MPRVTIIQVIYNSRRFIPEAFPAMLNQTVKDAEYVAVICGNADGSKELIAKDFPQVRIIDPGANLGFAGAHNLVFSQSQSDFFLLVNPDEIIAPNYTEELLKAFADPRVGAATGKILKYDFDKHQKTDIIDSTGVTVFKSGAARDRGQHEVDNGQYDRSLEVDAVSGAGCMYRASALDAVKIRVRSLHPSPFTLHPNFEYFDQDFHSYWEDVDLGWRMKNAGWKCVYQPTALAWHGRAAGSSQGGYKKVFAYINFHRQLPARIRELNYRNHFFMYLKNSRRLYPQFWFREFAMLCYILLFEPGTLKVVPQILKLLPKMWQKRKYIQYNINHGRD